MFSPWRGEGKQIFLEPSSSGPLLRFSSLSTNFQTASFNKSCLQKKAFCKTILTDTHSLSNLRTTSRKKGRKTIQTHKQTFLLQSFIYLNTKTSSHLEILLCLKFIHARRPRENILSEDYCHRLQNICAPTVRLNSSHLHPKQATFLVTKRQLFAVVEHTNRPTCAKQRHRCRQPVLHIFWISPYQFFLQFCLIDWKLKSETLERVRVA